MTDHSTGIPSVLFATSFPPAVGGMETLLYQTARRLESPPLVLAPAPAAAPDLPVRPVATSPRTLVGRAAHRAGWRLHPSLHYLRAFLPAAARAVRDTRPSVIQCGHVYLAPLAWLLARRAGLPFVVYAFGQEVWRSGHPMGLPALDRLLRGRALAAADLLFTPGSFTEGLLADWDTLPGRWVRVPYGADPRPPTDPPSGTSLLTVSRLVPRKGIDTVLRALPSIARRIPDVEYRVVGAGPDEARLRRLVAETDVAGRVQFLGRVDDDRLADEYRRAALFVLPSRRTADGQLEGLGLVYLEAAAWGRPVVAGRSGGEVDGVDDGVTGCLVDGTSAEQVAETVTGLLSDPSRLRAMGEAGRRRIEATHNWREAARTVDRALASLTGRPAR